VEEGKRGEEESRGRGGAYSKATKGAAKEGACTSHKGKGTGEKKLRRAEEEKAAC